MRTDGRRADQLRPITFDRDFTEAPAGSVLVSFGKTRVLCTASVDEDVPRWMKGRGKGWVTAEYSMLPGSSPERVKREVKDGRPSGRTQEIQRLIGRSLRAVCDMTLLGERQVLVDCDVLQADGGTRTASICGGYLALHDALSRLVQAGTIKEHPITEPCAAISVGIIGGVPMLDLAYVEDVRAEVDMNVVMTGSGRFVEVQGTAEGSPYSRAELDALLDLAEAGIADIVTRQEELTVTAPPAAPDRAMTALRLVLASANPHKAEEIAVILGGAGIEVTPRPPDVPDVVEDADTLEGNARLKAVAISAATGAAAVADDTGLEVDALGGAPGVYSARYAGEHVTYADNVGKLLAELHRVGATTPQQRTARFRAVALVRFPDGREVSAEGVVEGTIAAVPAGSGGFGYDPVFVPAGGDGRSFAEMSEHEKHAVSHRGRAFRALAERLR